jgi:hypothetical protein
MPKTTTKMKLINRRKDAPFVVRSTVSSMHNNNCDEEIINQYKTEAELLLNNYNELIELTKEYIDLIVPG